MERFPLTIDEYLEAEKKTGVKHEYVNGYIHAMVGGSRRHNLLTVSLVVLLKSHLSGTGCRVYASDMKVKAGSRADNIFFYPDVMVSCNRQPQDRYVEHEPKLIVEVLSPGTEQYDRLGKLEAYTQVVTLEEYVLVDQRDMKVDVYRRSGDQWILTRYGEGDALQLASIDFIVPVSTVYQDVVGIV